MHNNYDNNMLCNNKIYNIQSNYKRSNHHALSYMHAHIADIPNRFPYTSPYYSSLVLSIVCSPNRICYSFKHF